MPNLSLTARIIENNMEDFIKKCEDAAVTNEQWFIDFEIKMSELSTMDHSRTNKK